MKEFKYCHEEITEGVEIPVAVCETQKEMVAELVMQKEYFDFAAIRMNEVEEKRINGYYNLTDGTLHEYAYREAMKEAISGTDEEMMYIIYKDGSEYWNGADEVHGKFKRYGIKRAIISTPWGYTVFGDFAINDMGDVTIEGSEIKEYGVYAGQYDVKEEPEAAETVESVEETTVSETETVETEVAEKFIIYVSDDDLNVFCAKVFVGTVKELDNECDRIIAETNCEEYLHVLCYTDKRWEWVQKHYNQVSKSALSVVVRKTETAEQETELNAEVAQVEAEQTENNAESISETHDSKDVKANTSKADELSATTKTLMTFSFVVSEYLRQKGYIDTS